METHHNQGMTDGARSRVESSQKVKAKKKVVALQLTDKEALALKHLGGNKALKALLCPPGICVACRDQRALEQTFLGAYCRTCSEQFVDQA